MPVVTLVVVVVAFVVVLVNELVGASVIIVDEAVTFVVVFVVVVVLGSAVCASERVGIKAQVAVITNAKHNATSGEENFSERSNIFFFLCLLCFFCFCLV